MEDLELGGNITLVGFKDIDRSNLVVVKKLVGQYARKFSDTVHGFEGITVTLKIVHHTQASEKHELHARAIVDGKPIVAESVERNLFVGLDEVLKRVLTIAEKK